MDCSSCPWDSMPDINNLKGRFQRIWSTITEPHISGLIVGKDIMVVGVGQKSIFMVDRKQGNRGKNQGQIIAPRTCPSPPNNTTMLWGHPGANLSIG